MVYTNSFAIIRTRNGNTVGCHTVFTHRFKELHPPKFHCDERYACDKFEITETVGGKISVKTTDKMVHSKVEVTNTIFIRNVTAIEIFTVYES